MSPEQKPTWDCETCRRKNIHIARNCNNEFEKTTIVINKRKAYTQCPVSLIKTEHSEIYQLLKLSLNAEMRSFLPKDLLEIPNIWFELSTVLNKAEADYRRDKG